MPILRLVVVPAAAAVLLAGLAVTRAPTPVSAGRGMSPDISAAISAQGRPRPIRVVPTSAKRCYASVRLWSGKRVNRAVPCRAVKQRTIKPGPAAKPAPKPSAAPQGATSCSVINGVRGGTRPGHRAALDYMASGGQGQAIANAALAQMRSGQCGVKYVIFQQTYYGPGSPGGSRMEDRGSATQNHMDHVHVEY